MKTLRTEDPVEGVIHGNIFLRGIVRLWYLLPTVHVSAVKNKYFFPQAVTPQAQEQQGQIMIWNLHAMTKYKLSLHMLLIWAPYYRILINKDGDGDSERPYRSPVWLHWGQLVHANRLQMKAICMISKPGLKPSPSYHVLSLCFGG